MLVLYLTLGVIGLTVYAWLWYRALVHAMSKGHQPMSTTLICAFASPVVGLIYAISLPDVSIPGRKGYSSPFASRD